MRPLFQSVEAIVVEDGLACVSAVDDVIDRSGKLSLVLLPPSANSQQNWDHYCEQHQRGRRLGHGCGGRRFTEVAREDQEVGEINLSAAVNVAM